MRLSRFIYLTQFYICLFLVFFFFNDPATPEIYTLPLPDALPISGVEVEGDRRRGVEISAGSPAVGVRVQALVTTVVVVGIRVPDPDEDLVVLVIDGPRLPGSATAIPPGVALPGRQGFRVVPPRRVEDPLDVAGLGVDPEDLSLDRILAAVLPHHE